MSFDGTKRAKQIFKFQLHQHQFWNLESFRTLPKTHPNRLPIDEKKVVNILEKTGEFI